TTGFYRISGGVTDAPGMEGLLKIYVTSATSVVQEFVSLISVKSSFYRVLVGGVWTSWREIFHTGNVLGTVSQSGGVPTGAIIERGSNANGEYVRFADGTQICVVLAALETSPTADKLWTYPAQYISAPAVAAQFAMFTFSVLSINGATTTSAVFNAYDAS